MGYKRPIPTHLECPFEPEYHCRDCDCKKRCFFNFLSPDSLKRFKAERRMRLYKAHQLIFNEGDQPQGMHMLCVGDVKLVKSDAHGRELTVSYLSCGDLVGDAPFWAGGHYCSSAETLRESVVCFLHRGLVEYLERAEPEFGRRSLQRISVSLCRCMDRVVGMAFKSAEARLAAFLLALKQPPVSNSSLPCHLKPAYSRREIADNLGLSPETVIRGLSAFQRRGLIRVSGKSIDVKDKSGLESVAAER
ncbi:MAG: Crp/Fnr family transcriptional regulator [Elusimicrobia bacterium]|nr:Crp/Fnr family transcriptional regulator [Elusimicrobiota bacterium]